MAELQVPQTNFLQMAAMANQIKASKANQNYLTKKQGWEEEDRKYNLNQRDVKQQRATEDRGTAEESRKYQIESQAISTALKSGNQEQANQIYKSLGGMSENGITITGKDVSIDYGDHEFKGPAKTVSELVENLGKNPDFAKDPKTWAWFAKNGGSIDKTDPKAPKRDTYQRGRENITQEWDGEKWNEIGRGPKDKAPTGMEITTSDGTVIRTGVPQGNEPTKPVKTKVQSKLLEANETYSNLKSTFNKYDDSFLMGKDKLGFNLTAFKEKWNLGTVSKDEKKKLAQYTDFKRDSISGLNSYIKQITGAAMSEQEAKRLMKGMPNPGIGMFDGDSPTEFKAKMGGVMQQLDRVIARSNYVNKNGLKSIGDVGLDQMDNIIDKRGDELEQSIKLASPDINNDELEKMVIKTLSEEFGIRF